MVLANSMVTRMSIKNKVWLLGSFGLCLTVVVGALGFWGVSAVVTATETMDIRTAALRNHLEADMMHDALRADALAAMLAGPSAFAEKKDEVRADLAEHTKNFRDALAENASLPLAPALRSLIEEATPSLDGYITETERVVELAFADADAAAALGSFMEAFTALEGKMSEMSDAIEAAVSEAREGAQGTGTLAKLAIAVAALLGALAAMAVAWANIRATVRPIQSVAAAMNVLAKGEDEFEITEDKRGDEIGQMWQAMRALRETVRKSFELGQLVEEMPINIMQCDAKEFKVTFMNRATRETLTKLRALLPCDVDKILGQSIDIFHKNPEHQRRILSNPANLPYTAKIRLGDETLALQVAAIRDRKGGYIGPVLTWSVATAQVNMAKRVQEVVGIVASAAAEMEASAQSLAATAEETNRQATAVAAASEEASTNVQTVASATEELSASVSEIGKQVGESSRIAQQAVVEAERTNAAVKGLAEAADKIGAVVQLINDIASQTNLLALNATIEAARAGEAGKGFAVVASEVKTLANQTAKATEEIGAQIAAIQTATGDSVQAIQGIGATIKQINEIAAAIAAAVEEQGAATQEISRNVQQAAAGTTEVSTNIASVSQAATQTGSAAGEVLSGARELAGHGTKLNTEIEEFLRAV